MPDGRTNSNSVVTDKSGESINVLIRNGKSYPPFGEDIFNGIKNTEIRDSDVLLCGYQKTGCHWCHEIIHMLVTGKAELTKHGKVFGGFIDAMPQVLIESLPSPRVLNTHLLYNELPEGIKEKKTKIILTVRNPKDTVVSFYNHLLSDKDAFGYNGTFNDFFDLFIEDPNLLPYGSYFDFYKDWDILLQNPDKHPILLIEFEKNKENPKGCIKKIAQFLKINISEELIDEIAAKTSFKSVKSKRVAQGGFGVELYRKGITQTFNKLFYTLIDYLFFCLNKCYKYIYIFSFSYKQKIIDLILFN